MRGVAGLLAMEIALAIAARARRITRAVLRLEALHRRPGCNLRPVDREMLVRQQPTQLRMLHERGQKLPRHVCFKQPIAVLREHPRNPYRLVHAETNEPAVEQVVVELLHQLPLRADGIERLQQERPQQSLRRDRRPAAVRVRPGKIAVERRQHLVHDRPHQPQRVFGWDALLKVNIGKQFTRPLVQTPHRCLRQPTHTTNHIRSSLSGGFFSSLLVLLSQRVAGRYLEESSIWRDSLFSMRRAEMGLPKSSDAASRFSAYVDGLTNVIGHAGRAKPLRDYCTGLMMPCERKSVEPMAAMTAPERTAAQHQSLLHFVGEGDWRDEKVLAKVREMVMPAIERHGPIEAWIIDDTGFPKKGRHSVGVARQYCGELGKQDNCQIALTLSIANHHASLPVAYRLYLPKEWTTDRPRRRKAGVPKDITFKTKPAIALEQLRWACAEGLSRGVVLMDAGYGTDTDLRTSITALGLSYVAGIQPQTSVWAPGTGPRPPKGWSGQGRPPKLLRRDGRHQPISVKKLALGLPMRAWRKITWREGTAEPLSSRFARVRVRAAHRDYWLPETRPEEWLLIEWPEGEEAPPQYWVSTLPTDIAFHQLVDTAKLRWRIERDYHELKQEIGLGHFEGQGWRGFHHHATLCIAAYGFLVSERETIPPSETGSTRLFEKTTV